MNFAQSMTRITPIAFIVALAGAVPVSAGGPETSIQTEYLMTLHAPLDPPQSLSGKIMLDCIAFSA